MISEQKLACRKRLIEQRAALDHDLQRVNDQRITARLLALPLFMDAKIVFCYVSHNNEIDTHELIRFCFAEEKTLAVPKITGKESMSAVQIRQWDELEPAELGILSPRSRQAVEGVIDVCVTPGLGFSPAGQRLGFGKGYYDRWFAEHSVGCRIGLAYEWQLIDDLPHDTTDVPMDMILTEERFIQV